MMQQPQALPPSLSGSPPPGYSPASVSSGNPGEIASALAQVRQAINLLQTVLPKLPIGTGPHKAVMESIKGLAKIVPAADQSPGIQKTALNNLQQQQSTQEPMQAMIQSMGQGQQGGMGGMPQPSPQQAA